MMECYAQGSYTVLSSWHGKGRQGIEEKFPALHDDRRKCIVVSQDRAIAQLFEHRSIRHDIMKANSYSLPDL